ncbi:MAG: aminotransferase class I/II-fold pyridoxal phosphate-dependent enzyme, partial [Planctomycetales bacterium]|nr:aminotransferase class I/II-fold pyridoxal phosphate-dependent enzyme [Planctomycetales bacterium]
IFGGQPAFADPLHVGRPNLPNRDRYLARINDIFDRAWLTNDGTYLRQFEQVICDVTGASACVAVANGTIALQLLMQVLGLHGEVIVPSLTFIATAHALAWQGISPRFADVDLESCCLDPDAIEAAITPRTTAILAVHLWGRVCNVQRLQEIADRHGIELIFDASHAFGASKHGRMVGNWGRAETFSFHATKFVSAAEGGAIVTNDVELAERLRLARNFGFAARDHVSTLGINGKLSELHAALGLTSLEEMEFTIETNRRNAFRYAERLIDVPGVKLLTTQDQSRSNYQYVVVLIDDRVARIDRDTLVKVLEAENVQARRYFSPGCHRSAPYADDQGTIDGFWLPNTERIVSSAMSLPNGVAIDRATVDTVSDLVRFAVHSAAEIRGRMAARRPVVLHDAHAAGALDAAPSVSAVPVPG